VFGIHIIYCIHNINYTKIVTKYSITMCRSDLTRTAAAAVVLYVSVPAIILLFIIINNNNSRRRRRRRRRRLPHVLYTSRHRFVSAVGRYHIPRYRWAQLPRYIITFCDGSRYIILLLYYLYIIIILYCTMWWRHIKPHLDVHPAAAAAAAASNRTTRYSQSAAAAATVTGSHQEHTHRVHVRVTIIADSPPS